jgi:hypothetical protein
LDASAIYLHVILKPKTMTQDQIQKKYEEIINVLKKCNSEAYKKFKGAHQYPGIVLNLQLKELPKVLNVSERQIKVMRSKPSYKTIWDEADYLIKIYVKSNRHQNAISRPN